MIWLVHLLRHGVWACVPHNNVVPWEPHLVIVQWNLSIKGALGPWKLSLKDYTKMIIIIAWDESIGLILFSLYEWSIKEVFNFFDNLFENLPFLGVRCAWFPYQSITTKKEGSRIAWNISTKSRHTGVESVLTTSQGLPWYVTWCEPHPMHVQYVLHTDPTNRVGFSCFDKSMHAW